VLTFEAGTQNARSRTRIPRTASRSVPVPTTKPSSKFATSGPPAIALVATGAPILTAGIVMLAVDAHRQRRRRLAFAPHLGVGGCGLLVRGRF
jgi:hypothetical protein